MSGHHDTGVAYAPTSGLWYHTRPSGSHSRLECARHFDQFPGASSRLGAKETPRSIQQQIARPTAAQEEAKRGGTWPRSESPRSESPRSESVRSESLRSESVSLGRPPASQGGPPPSAPARAESLSSPRPTSSTRAGPTWPRRRRIEHLSATAMAAPAYPAQLGGGSRDSDQALGLGRRETKNVLTSHVVMPRSHAVARRRDYGGWKLSRSI
jgi:hypothetical protein